jgi:hypothetical protein
MAKTRYTYHLRLGLPNNATTSVCVRYNHLPRAAMAATDADTGTTSPHVTTGDNHIRAHLSPYTTDEESPDV